MGCCGCSLKTSAIVAAVFGIVESGGGFLAGIMFLTTYWDYFSYYPVASNITISATLFNALWLIATIVLIYGIEKENAAMHRLWVGVTSVITVVDVAHSIAFIVGIASLISNYQLEMTTQDSIYGIRNSYSNSYSYRDFFLLAVYMTAVMRDIFFWIINICLAVYTSRRAKEISRGPVCHGQTVVVFGNQPMLPYAMPGQTIVVQQGGASIGLPYGSQQAPCGQPPAYASAPDQGF